MKITNENRNRWALTGLAAGATAGIGWAGWSALTPQLATLLELAGVHGAAAVAIGMTGALLGAAALAGARGGKGARAITWAVVGLTACVALTRAKVVTDELAAADAQYDAAHAAYLEAKAARDEAIATAKADPDLNAQAPYLLRKREARAALERARALPVPAVPVKPATGLLTAVVAIGGPAGIEAVTAVLLELLAAGAGAWWAWLLAPLWQRREEVAEDPATIHVGPRGGRYRLVNGRRVYIKAKASDGDAKVVPLRPLPRAMVMAGMQ